MTRYVDIPTASKPTTRPRQGGTYTLHRDGEPVALLRAVIRCSSEDVVRDADGSVHVQGVKMTPEIQVVQPEADVALQHVREAQAALRLNGDDIRGNKEQADE